MSASWLEIIGLLLGGGAVAKLLDLILFRDQDAASLRRELLAEINGLREKVERLESEIGHWVDFANGRHLRCIALMLEVNDMCEAHGVPPKYTRQEIFAPPPMPNDRAVKKD